MSLFSAQALVALLAALQQDSLFECLLAEDCVDIGHFGSVDAIKEASEEELAAVAQTVRSCHPPFRWQYWLQN